MARGAGGPVTPARLSATSRAICGAETLVPDMAKIELLREPVANTPLCTRESSLGAMASGQRAGGGTEPAAEYGAATTSLRR